jgi:hypothetical protein
MCPVYSVKYLPGLYLVSGHDLGRAAMIIIRPGFSPVSDAAVAKAKADSDTFGPAEAEP